MKRYITTTTLLLLLLGCNTKFNKPDLDYCHVQDDLRYELMEIYFEKEKILTHDVVIHYLTNGNDNYSDDFFANRIEQVNPVFENSNRKFEVVKIVRYDKRPEQYPSILSKIEAIENINGNREDLRSKFHINHFDWWNMFLKIEGAINIYIFENQSGYAGVAGGIGSDFMAVRTDYLDVRDCTIEHELGHCLGLRHLHETDHTNGFNRDYGDLCNDTAVTEVNLSKYMNNNCDYFGYRMKGIPPECQSIALQNFMAYNIKKCRVSFTDDQNKRMQWMTENNQDVRKTIRELKNVPDFKMPEKLDI